MLHQAFCVLKHISFSSLVIYLFKKALWANTKNMRYMSLPVKIVCLFFNCGNCENGLIFCRTYSFQVKDQLQVHLVSLLLFSLPPSSAIYLSHLLPFISSSISDSSAPHSSILLQFLPSVSFYLSQCGARPLLSSLMSTGLIRLTRWGCCSSTPPSPSPSSSSHLWFHYAWSASQHHLHLRALRRGAVVCHRGDTTHAVRWHKDISWRCWRGGCTFKNAPFTYNPLSSFRARWRAELTGLISNSKIGGAFYNPIFKKNVPLTFFLALTQICAAVGGEWEEERERGSCKSILIREQGRKVGGPSILDLQQLLSQIQR